MYKGKEGARWQSQNEGETLQAYETSYRLCFYLFIWKLLGLIETYNCYITDQSSKVSVVLASVSLVS